MYYRITVSHLVSGSNRPVTINLPENVELNTTEYHFEFYQPGVGPVFSYHKDQVLKLERIEDKEESDEALPQPN